MSVESSKCLEPDVLAAFVEGSLSAPERDAVEEHCDSCAECLEVVGALGRAVSRARSVGPRSWTSDAGAEVGEDEELRPGTAVGRYVLLDVAGQGGMGTVYAAYDPQLDRRVALKLLRVGGTSIESVQAQSARLLREAQTLGKVPDPNVVPVYDVGTAHGRLFIAMQYVEGVTLRRWLAQERSVEEILDVFVQAGRGLAAAHEAEIVHRDFKPSNVLVTPSGRAVVVDFGLARLEVEPASRDAGLGSAGARGSPGSYVVGTPAYMSPEHRTGSTTARSDQYSFCVALWEALYRERPPVDAVRTDDDAVDGDGRRADPTAPSDLRVPRRVRAALERGLRTDPAERFDSMAALLAELAPTPGRKRALATIGALAVVAIAAAVIAASSPEPVAAPCASAQEHIDEVWNEARRSRVRDQLLATGIDYAEPVARAAVAALDDYAHRWTDHHTEACRATRVSGEQSERHMELRMLCLERGRLALDATARVLEQADADTLAHADQAARNLPAVDACDDIESLAASVPPPDDAEARARLDALQATRAEVAALRDAGKTAEALKIAEGLVEDAAALGYRPFVADCLQVLGDLQDRASRYEEAEKTLYRALWEAQASRYDFVVAQAWNNLIYTVGFHLARHDELDRLAQHAQAAIERLGPNADLAAQRLLYLGHAYREAGRLDEAVAVHTELTDRFEEGSKDARARASAWSALSTSLKEAGRFREAEEAGQKAARAFEDAGLAGHPLLADMIANLANLKRRQGKLEEALEAHQKSLAILEAAHADEIRIAASTYNLATVLYDMGKYAEAEAAYRTVLDTFTRGLGEDHPHVGAVLNALALLLHERGKNEEALPIARKAVAHAERTLGKEHPRLANALTNLGLVLQALGNVDEAVDAHRRALAIVPSGHANLAAVQVNLALALLDKGDLVESIALCKEAEAHGREEEAAVVTHALLCQGDVLLERERTAEAIDAYRRAIEAGDNQQGLPRASAEARFRLAKALWHDRNGRDEARDLATRALTTFRQQGLEDSAADVEAWLTARD